MSTQAFFYLICILTILNFKSEHKEIYETEFKNSFIYNQIRLLIKFLMEWTMSIHILKLNIKLLF